MWLNEQLLLSVSAQVSAIILPIVGEIGYTLWLTDLLFHG